MTQSTADPYTMLGIPRDASQRTILEAYRRLAKQFHPDVASDPAAGERMRHINEAWRVLSSPSRRARFDSGLGSRASSEDGPRPFRHATRSTAYSRPDPVQAEVPADLGSLWPVVGVALGSMLLLFGAMVGFLPPLFLILLVFGAGRVLSAFS